MGANGASIPHLLRVHFAGVGHPDARLSPLTLSFQRVNDLGHPEPLDSVIWAENGVGKSSIRALLFSLLHPNIHDVMKSSQGPLDNRKYELFFGPNDSSYVVTEWAMPEREQRALTGFGEEPNTLVLGFAAFWPGNHRTSLGDLERHFFMFRPQGPFVFDRLPIQGLSEGAEPKAHVREFLDWFRENARNADGRHTTIHKEWSSWLAEVGLDPVIFSYQLRMNGAQGGILGLFKHRINSATDFVHFFLETVLSQDAASDVVEVLNEKKAHVEKKAQWEAEVTFVNEALPMLDSLQKERKAFEAHAEALEVGRGRAGSLVAGLEESEKEIHGQTEELKSKVKDIEKAIKTRQESFVKYQEYRAWLRYHESVLDFADAENELERRRAALDEAQKGLSLYRAALEHREWQAKLAECKAIEGELNARKDKHVDVEMALRNAGTALAQVIDREIKAARLALDDARNRLTRSRKTMVTNQKTYNKVKSDLGKVNEVIRGISGQMQSREKVLHRLVQSQALLENEAPGAAITRWKERLRETAAAIDNAQKNQLEFEEERESLQRRQQDRLIQITRHQGELERMEITREADRYLMEELETARELRLLTEEDRVNLANPELSGLLRERMVKYRGEIFELNRRQADDKETLANIEQSESRLYPPPAEVAKLLRVLRDDLKLPAFLAVEELDEKFPDDPAEAEQRFTRDPARYLGIMVRNRKALQQVKDHEDRIQKPAFPVQISYAEGALSEEIRDAVVLRPGHHAAFNRKAAASMIEPLKKGIAERQDRIDALHQTVERIAATHDKLLKFLETHADGTLGGLTKKIDEKRTLLGILEIEQQGEQEKIRSLDGDILGAGERLKKTLELRQNCENSLSRLRDFMEDHESRFTALVKELNEARDRLHRLEDQGMKLEASLDEDHHLVAEQQEALFNRKTALEQLEEKLRGVQFQGGELADIAKLTFTEAEHRYRLCLDRYKQVSEKDETLRARLEEKQAMAGEREQRYRKELGPHRDGEVLDILEAGSVTRKLAEAEKVERDAAKAVGAAESGLAGARDRLREAPTIPLDYQIPEGEIVPETAAEARDRRREVDRTLEGWRGGIETQREDLAGYREQLRVLHEDLTLRSLKAGELRTHIPELLEAVPETMPRDNDALNRLFEGFWEEFRNNRQLYGKSKLALDSRCERLKDLAHDQRFQEFPNDKREVLKNRESLMRLTEDIINEFNIFREVIETSLRMSEESVEAVLTRLDANISDALYLMDQAKSSSRMPDAMEAWSGLAFLKLDIPAKVPDRLEDRRPVYERVLREVLGTGKPIRGIDLIKRGIDALAGTKGYRVSVLKPSYTLKTDYHPVTDVKGWSDGEKITTVILLYCTMVQLRAYSTGGRPSRDYDRRLSNGMLFLDNPFGEANSLTFVKMQLSMARALNIQLVYTASGSHKHLMARFPRVIRLSQEAGGSTERTYVKATDVGREVRASINVTAAHFGKRRAS